MINIAIVSNTDEEGGADRAARRLHLCLEADDRILSKMYVNKAKSGDPSVIVPGGKVSRLMKELKPRLGRLIDPLQTNKEQGKLSVSLIPSRWASYLNKTDSDIIHLHWPMNEMMSIKDISRIRKPILWTLHDMWAFSGSEHYTTEHRYIEGYARNNRSKDETGLDLNRWTWKRKMRHWKQPFHILAPSRWMAQCASESKMMQGWPVHVIPNPIDTSFWKPEDKGFSRSLINLPQEKKLILFGSFGGTKDKRKGFDLLQKALLSLNIDNSKLALVVLGPRDENEKAISAKYETHYLGHFHDDLSIKIAYNAADLIILPSRQDNLPNMAIEGMSCGVPVAGFNVCGIPDIIEHKTNGWLAAPFEASDLAKGIEWILNDDMVEEKLSKQARVKALNSYSYSTVSEQFFSLYSNILSTYQ